MAEAFGSRLLSELQITNLSDLLSSVSASLPLQINPLVPNVAFLNDLLSQPVLPPTRDHTQHDPRDIPSSQSASPHSDHDSDTNNQPAQCVQPPFIEIISATTNASRTHLLTYLLANLLSFPAEDTRPKGIVIYFDCSFKLPLSATHTSLVESGYTSTATDAALSRLHVLRPSSSREVLNWLRNLEDYIFSMDKKDITLVGIVVADLGAFYWSERWSEEEARLNGPREKVLSRESTHSMIVEVVGRLHKTFQCVIIVSGMGIPTRNFEGDEGVRSGLTNSWVRPVDVRIVLNRATNGQIEAKVDARKWLSACQVTASSGQAHFSISVDARGVPQVSKLQHDQQ